MALLARTLSGVDPTFSVISTMREEVDFASVKVRPFYSEIASLPVGRIPFRTRARMIRRYREAFGEASSGLELTTSVLYSSELPFGILERSALARLKPHVRKLTRLVHNVDNTSSIQGLFDDHVFLSESERKRGLEVLKIPMKASFAIPMPHFGTVMQEVVPDDAVGTTIHTRAASRTILAFISRANLDHGIDLFYRLLALARRLELPLCGVVIGRPDKGWTATRDVALRTQLAVGNSIAWSHLGPYTTEALRAVLTAADAVVAPYRSISQSAAIALALGEKVPVLASHAGANHELVRDGVDGTFFDPTDTASTTELLLSVYGNGGRARDRFPAGPIGEHLDPVAVASMLMSRLKS